MGAGHWWSWFGVSSFALLGCGGLAAPPTQLGPPATPESVQRPGPTQDPVRVERTVRACGQDVPVSTTAFSCNDLQFDDLRSLDELSSLTQLDLSGSGVTDLSPLAGRGQLTALDLEHTDVTDLTPLAELPRLQRLKLLYRTTVATGDPRVLTALNRPTPKLDLTPLSKISTLERVVLGFVGVDSLAPLASATGLKHLGLISVEGPARALLDIASLSRLERVVLMGAPCRNLEALSPSTGLLLLSVHGCRRVDLRPLAPLTKLVHLTLSDVEGRGARALGSLREVRHVDLSDSRLDDYTFLRHMPSLVTANLADSAVTDLSPVSGLSALQTLDVSGTKISRLSALFGAQSLRWLTLTGNDTGAGPAPKLAPAALQLARKLTGLQIRYRDPFANPLAQWPELFDDAPL